MQTNIFWHIQNHLQYFGKIQNHYRTIFKKLCIQNNVLYTEPAGSTAYLIKMRNILSLWPLGIGLASHVIATFLWILKV